MAQLIFPSGAFASTLVTNITTIKIRKNIGKGLISNKVTTSIGGVGRKRSLSLTTAQFTSNLTGTLKRRLLLPSGAVASTTTAKVRFFLAAGQTPPPIGKIYRADIASQPALNGSRLVRGDLIPLTLKITGIKLAGLNAIITAKRKDDPLASPIIKSGSAIHQTAPVIDPQTGVESVSGSFAIEPADTEGFPEKEVELGYFFKLTDGLGRIYTIEIGTFTIYN
jgi:hypothetical protein